MGKKIYQNLVAIRFRLNLPGILLEEESASGAGSLNKRAVCLSLQDALARRSAASSGLKWGIAAAKFNKRAVETKVVKRIVKV